VRLIKYIALTSILLYPAGVRGQSTPCSQPVDLSSSLLTDAHRALWHALAVTQTPDRSDFLRSASMGRVLCADSAAFLQPWSLSTTPKTAELLPVAAALMTNSAYPRSINDGALWDGAGANFGVTLGARGTYKALRWQIAPEFYYQQNKEFVFVHSTAPGYSEFGNPYQSFIDWPTRFGTKSFTTTSLGQSFVQAQYHEFSATFGTENLWMGSAHVYPILMSYTAPGFPHLRLGTQRAISIPGFDLEVQLIFGSLHESEFFDTISTNNNHFFGTTMIVLNPHFLKGLSLGLARAVHDTASVKGKGPGYFLHNVVSSPFGGLQHSGNAANTNALGVVMARWVLPESKFEAYAEWGREDTPGGFIDLLREPDWTQAYVLGFQKSYITHDKIWQLYGELNHLGESAPSRAGRGFFSYYTHNTVRQGHTNDGQLLGAAIGPGSDVQVVGADAFTSSSRTGFYIERTRYDDDTYYRTFARRFGETRHDAEITLSGTRSQMFSAIEVGGTVTLSRRYGRQFIPLPTGDADLIETNIGLRLFGAWRPHF